MPRQLLGSLLTVCLLLLASCRSGAGDGAKSELPIVTVTIEPQAWFAKRIAGDKFDIKTMVPSGSSPESFDPSPGDLVKLADSRAYFRIGHIGFEQAWMNKLRQANPDMQVFDNSQGIALIAGHNCADDHDHDADGHDHSHDAVDPHIWESPANGLTIARNMLDAFVRLDPANRAYYEANASALMADIAQTADSIDLLLAGLEGRSFVIYHPSLTYLAHEYGLNQLSIEEGGKEPSAAQLKALIDRVRRSGAQVIFIQQEFDAKNARTIADELQIPLVAINPLSADWSSELIQIAKAIHDGENH
jgi:zinc transport system substrate-binding protein